MKFRGKFCGKSVENLRNSFSLVSLLQWRVVDLLLSTVHWIYRFTRLCIWRHSRECTTNLSLSLAHTKQNKKIIRTHTLSLSHIHIPFHSLFPPKLTAPYSHAWYVRSFTPTRHKGDSRLCLYSWPSRRKYLSRRESRNARRVCTKKREKKKHWHPFDGPATEITANRPKIPTTCAAPRGGRENTAEVSDRRSARLVVFRDFFHLELARLLAL